MRPNSFSLQTVASLNWRFSSGVPMWQTLDFRDLHRKKSKEFKAVNQMDQSIVPSLPIHLASQFSVKIPLLLCQNMEVRRRVAATFVLMLEAAHPLITEVIHLPRELLQYEAIKCHTLTTNRCWKWHCATWCWLSCAQECLFFLLAIACLINCASCVNRM
jgi:hypothetical protein